MLAVAWIGMPEGQARCEGLASDVVRIEGGALADALRRVGRETQTTILFAPALVAGRHTGQQRLKGDTATMLRHLLAGTGLRVRIINAHAMLIEAAPVRQPRPRVPPCRSPSRRATSWSRRCAARHVWPIRRSA
jgi:hypothetical protein